MSSISTSSTFNVRTYGKKYLAKRKRSIDPTTHQKRRKISVEPELPTDTEQDERELPDIPYTYGSPKQKLQQERLSMDPAKDLSSIFQSVTPTSSPLPSPKKLTSRMLARSKTDSSIESSPNINVGRTPSLPILPSSSPPKSSTSFDDLPPPTVSLPVNTRTYAGKSRSFLVALPPSTGDSAFPYNEEEDDTTRESYASLRLRWGVDNSEDDPYLPASPSRSNYTSTPNGTPTKPKKAKGREHQEVPLRTHTSLPNGMMNPLKSITELRSKGESRRFLDEVGYLFEGMDIASGAGLRRASALEITTKLCDIEFARKAKAADFLSKAWDVFIDAGAGRGEDKILDALLAFFAALVSRDPAALTDLAQRSSPTSSSELAQGNSQKQKKHPPSSLVDTLFLLLRAPVDPLALILTDPAKDNAVNNKQLKIMGIGNKDRGLFLKIHHVITSKSSLFPANTAISAPLLLTYSLQTLPPALISATHLPILLMSLRRCLSPIISSTSTAYLSWPEIACDIPLQNVYYHLRMFDMYLLGQWHPIVAEEDEERRKIKAENRRIMDEARDNWLIDTFITLGVCAELRGGAVARNCTEVLLRVLVTLTHANVVCARKVMECEYALGFVIRLILRSMDAGGEAIARMEGEKGDIKEEIKEQDDEINVDGGSPCDQDRVVRALDQLCLALGLLTNLVQAVDTIKNLLHETRLNPFCDLTKRACIRQCTCSSVKKKDTSISALDVLVQLYNRQLAHINAGNENIKSEGTPPPHPIDTADALFLRGHLAVLFGLLMCGSPVNQVHILNALGGSKGTTLGRLVEHAREFAAFYAVLSDSTNPREVGEQDGKVARDAAEFLEGLRTTTGA